MKQLADRQLWLGIGVGAAAILLSFALVATLMGGEIIGQQSLTGALCAGYFISCCAAGAVASAGKEGRLLRCILVWAVLYGTIWLVALSGGEAISFLPDGIYLTVSLLAGAVVAAMVAPKGKKRRKKGSAAGKRAARRHMVT